MDTDPGAISKDCDGKGYDGDLNQSMQPYRQETASRVRRELSFLVNQTLLECRNLWRFVHF